MHAYGGFPKLGYLTGGPHNKEYSILGSILGSPYFGKLPCDDNNNQKNTGRKVLVANRDGRNCCWIK